MGWLILMGGSTPFAIRSCENEGERLIMSQGVAGPGDADMDRSEEEEYCE